MPNIEEKVEKNITNKIEKLGYNIYDIEYVKEGKDYFLRIFIEKENGNIDLTDCEKVSNEINSILDEADIIKEQYFLEVSSTGIEKILKKEKNIQKAIGEEINIKLFKKDENGSKEYLGILKKINKEQIEIENIQEKEIKTTIIERKNIAQIKTVYNWE